MFVSWWALPLQEEYIKEEQRSLKRELLRAQEEVKRIQSVPLVIGQFLEMVDSNSGIVGSTTGSNYYVRILSTLNRELLKPSASIALHRHSNALVDILPPEADSSISLLTQSERPDVTYQVRPCSWSSHCPVGWMFLQLLSNAFHARTGCAGGLLCCLCVWSLQPPHTGLQELCPELLRMAQGIGVCFWCMISCNCQHSVARVLC
jgi:hypothetical protein